MQLKKKLLATAATLALLDVAAQQQHPEATTTASQPQLAQNHFSGNLRHTSTILYNTPDAYNEKKYRRFKKMRTAGIILTIAGTALTIRGVAMVASGLDNTNNATSKYHNVDNAGLLYFMGLLSITAGVTSMGGGITMWIIGNNKMKKHGGGQISLQSSKTGVGLSYRF